MTGVDTARLLDQARSVHRGRITRGIEGAAVEVVMVAHPSDRHRMPLAYARHIPFIAVQMTLNPDAAMLGHLSDGLVGERSIVFIFAFVIVHAAGRRYASATGSRQQHGLSSSTCGGAGGWKPFEQRMRREAKSYG